MGISVKSPLAQMLLDVLIYRHYQPGSGNGLAVSGKGSLLSI